MSLHGTFHRSEGNGLVLVDRQTQRLLHRVFAVVCRQLQNLQVFTHRNSIGVMASQCVVGHAKVAAGEHVLVILVVLKRSRLANQRVDHMTIVDGVLAAAE
jgi:hypothetical protein